MAATSQAITDESTDLMVHGMTCSNCVRHVREAIQQVEGVRQATVSLDVGRATIKWKREAEPKPDAVLRAVKEAGYTAEVAHSHDHSVSDWQIILWVGSVCTWVLMLGEWAFGLGLQRWFQWVAFALATVVQVYCGARFYRGAWAQLKRGNSNMDTL